MAPRTALDTATTMTRTTVTTTAVTTESDYARVECTNVKRVALCIINFIVGIISCVYISSAFRHSKVINENTDVLKDPYGGFDLSFEKVGYSFAIGRAVFSFLSIPLCFSVPEWGLFLISVLSLVFEIPLACVAESTFGYSVAYATLDLSPSNILCYSTAIPPQLWGFYTAYGKVVGKSTYTICREFTHEGSLLRGSLLFAWFTLWIVMFLIACFATLFVPASERSWATFLVCFTGIEIHPSWAGFKSVFSFKLTRPGFLRRPSHANSGVGSDASTLADESVTVEVKGKM